MNRIGQIARRGAHLDGEHAFADQLAGAGADDAHAQYPFGFRFDDQFRQTVGPVQRQSPARGAPEKFRDFDLDIFLFGFAFGQAAPGHFGIGVDHRRHNDVFKRARLAEQRFDGDSRLARGAMGQEQAAGNVADGVNIRIVGLLLGVAGDEAFVVLADLGVFQAEVDQIGRTADAHQHTIVKFFARLLVDFQSHFDLFAHGGHFYDFGVDANLFEKFLRCPGHRTHQIGIDAG